MSDFKADAHLFCILAENLLVGDYNEAGGIRLRLVHGLFKHLQPVYLARIFAGNSRLRTVALLRYLSGGKGVIGQADLLPVMLRQKPCALHQ